MNQFILSKEISVAGRLFRTAKLRHEWCEFLQDAPRAIIEMRKARLNADLFAFVHDLCDQPREYSYQRLSIGLAVLPVTTYDKWWDEIGYKTRNKLRKGLKSGVELRLAVLDDDFARGVAAIYNETPLKQGRRFYHYGKKAQEVKEELSSFTEQSTLVGAYFEDRLVGFMKLFQGNNVLRTVHIIASVGHRDKNIMDILIAKGVELCSERKIQNLHYGSWTGGGVGTFRIKHGFQRVEVPRFFVPLSLRGQLMLRLKLHLPARERLPESWIAPAVGLRTKWNSFRFGCLKAGGINDQRSAVE
jgi:hypothetical protein